MSHSFPKDDDVPPSAPPPTYEEALNAPPVLPGRPAATSPPQQDCYTAPNAPPPQPPRPSVQGPSYGNPSQNNQGAHPVNSSSSSLYTNNPDLPFDYPRGHFCNKCKNTGFKESGKPCSKCWPKFFRDRSYNPNPSLPFTYPKGYICDKCRNTGVKLKNGQSCQDCYTFFAPRNHTSQTPLTFSAPYPSAFCALWLLEPCVWCSSWLWAWGLCSAGATWSAWPSTIFAARRSPYGRNLMWALSRYRDGAFFPRQRTLSDLRGSWSPL
ncbi:hypothetical protein JCM33374_g956 [Metschnikowia sp. JCM 33374]|nr:hypothetical protein JCM33374_g956 [Metschnikowia sp. JCM 33374]